MSRESIAGLAGIIVLVAGLVALVTMLGGGETAEGTTSASLVPGTSTTTMAPGPVEIPLPELPGVPNTVERVLYWRGSAEAVATDELAGIPPEVARILVAYQVPLMVPEKDLKEVAR